MRFCRILLGLGLCVFCIGLRAESDLIEKETKPLVTFGGYIDTYYLYDFNQPVPNERIIGTPNNVPGSIAQVASTANRHNEFNINLAYLDAKLAASDLRGRLALQAGTSVQAIYAGEPVSGIASGPSLSQHIQEASLGYRITDKLWVDAGIFLSHLGLESFVSKDNWTYTRSLMADFSPYYEAGVKLSYQASSRLDLQLLVLNGWQNISDANSNKAVGAAVSYALNDELSLAYNNFFGEETGSLWRFFNDFILKWNPTGLLQIALAFDVGWQKRPLSTGASSWYGATLVARYQLSKRLWLAARFERYSDSDRVIAQPVSNLSMRANGASMNLDCELRQGLLWRNEVRSLWADSAVFAKGTGFSSTDVYLVTSLSFAF